MHRHVQLVLRVLAVPQLIALHTLSIIVVVPPQVQHFAWTALLVPLTPIVGQVPVKVALLVPSIPTAEAHTVVTVVLGRTASEKQHIVKIALLVSIVLLVVALHVKFVQLVPLTHIILALPYQLVRVVFLAPSVLTLAVQLVKNVLLAHTTLILVAVYYQRVKNVLLHIQP